MLVFTAAIILLLPSSIHTAPSLPYASAMQVLGAITKMNKDEWTEVLKSLKEYGSEVAQLHLDHTNKQLGEKLRKMEHKFDKLTEPGRDFIDKIVDYALLEQFKHGDPIQSVKLILEKFDNFRTDTKLCKKLFDLYPDLEKLDCPSTCLAARSPTWPLILHSAAPSFMYVIYVAMITLYARSWQPDCTRPWLDQKAWKAIYEVVSIAVLLSVTIMCE